MQWNIILAVCIAFLLFVVNIQNKDIEKLEQENNSHQVVADNAIKTVSLFNKISKITQSNNEKIVKDVEKKIVYINKGVESSKCADKYVPNSAANELFQLADSLRAKSSYATTSKFTK